jgi:hypothetical protein
LDEDKITIGRKPEIMSTSLTQELVSVKSYKAEDSTKTTTSTSAHNHTAFFTTPKTVNIA